MALFSERYGYKAVRTALQHEEMDENLRTDLWNIMHVCTQDADSRYAREFAPYLHIWIHLWHRPLDDIPYSVGSMSPDVKRYVLGAEWFDVYDLVELFVRAHKGHLRQDPTRLFNSVLEKNLSAYRVVDARVVRIDEDSDVEAIEQALRDAADLTGAKRHLQQALSHLADRKTPDYENSIKESISAVEAACQHIAGKRSASLGEAIKALRSKGVTIHPALEKSWLAAYGYTSDADGIRHALEGESTVDQARARYFLVTCSAFVSLLLSQAASAGLVSDEG